MNEDELVRGPDFAELYCFVTAVDTAVSSNLTNRIPAEISGPIIEALNLGKNKLEATKKWSRAQAAEEIAHERARKQKFAGSQIKE